ncbi:MAG TPA: hypothetical protein DHW02_20565 [Ktedonobacter sp.]|nr:hypothetical protein [Ktedonobacter sp.]
MIDRLQEVLPHLEHLPPEAQEEVANYIEALEQEIFIHGEFRKISGEISQTEHWVDPVGSLSDLPEDMFDELDRIRHTNPPTPPIES